MTGRTRRVTLRSGGATDVGRVRSVNEDNVLVTDGLYAVADGMGGHAAGEVASQVAVEAFQVSAGRSTAKLVEAVKVANLAVIQRQEREPRTRGMGTTLCAVALVEVDGDEDEGDQPDGGERTDGPAEQLLAVVNVGDSRVYLYQGGELIQLTEDHSLVEDMVRQGQLAPEEAREHPARNIVTRVLGNEPDVEVDVWEVTPNAGDRYLLCSDGLFGELTDDQIAAVLRRLEDPQEAAQELVRLANDAGGRDNVSVVLVDVVDDAGMSAAAAAAGADAVRTRPATGEPATADGDDAAPAGRRGRRARRAAAEPGVKPRRFTWRVAVFVLAVVAVIGAGAGVTAWYARNAWFVGLEDDRVVIFKGRPGGLLWFDPTVEERTSLAADDVPPARLDDLRDGKEQPSLDAARRFVANLHDEADRLGLGRTTTTTVTGGSGSGSGATTTTTAAPGAGG